MPIGSQQSILIFYLFYFLSFKLTEFITKKILYYLQKISSSKSKSMYTTYIILFCGVVILFSSFVTVRQGTIGVITVFGKYRRLLKPGLSLKIPLIEVIHSRVSIQNRAVELEFQAVTIDQANVYFKAMVLYSVNNPD